MKAYLITTSVVFGVLTLAHVWRVIEEGTSLLTNPWWVVITVVAAALCAWACRLLWLMHRGSTVYPSR